MATTVMSVKYRPIKVGFLVRDKNVEDLVKAAGINTLLWGGIYNPIIPVSEDNIDFCNQLLKLFSVDVLFAVSHTPEINKFINDNLFLRDSGYHDENIFYKDWNTKKYVLRYLDSINIVEYYYERDFKNKPKKHKSNFTLVKWEDTDACNNLFSILFGYFPTSYNLKDDFQNAFYRGLRSREVNITQGGSINKDLAKYITPIEATALELSGYGGAWRGNGLYIGSANDFLDLLYFWNIRAAGLTLGFLPKNFFDRFGSFVRAYIKHLDEAPTSNLNIIEDCVKIYYRNSHEDIRSLIKGFQKKKQFVFSHCDELIWNGLNVKPDMFYFDLQQTLASVDKSYIGHNVTTALPEKRFLGTGSDRRGGNVGLQHLVVSISPIGEFSYPEYTLKPPFIYELNEFYSRKIMPDSWLRVRSEKDGIGIIIKEHENLLSLYPISRYKLIEKIFELAGFKADMSQAGLLANRIIHNMGDDYPLEACRVFKITGIRKLISSLSVGESIKWSEATKIIWDNGFQKFENLFIEPRSRKKLETNEVFNYLIKKKIFAPKLNFLYRILGCRKNFKCHNCKLKKKILLNSYTTNWECPFCGHSHFMPSCIAKDFQNQANKYWKFVRSGLFAKENNQEGAIPVILSLLVFSRIFEMNDSFTYSTSLNLKNSNKCEVDFCVLQYERGGKIQIGIAECKSEGQKINQKDVDNLKQVQDKIDKLGIDCYIIFSKTADSYEMEEIELFKSLDNEDRKFVILSNQELESYHPYRETGDGKELSERYASDMAGMYRNSLFLYLQEKE